MSRIDEGEMRKEGGRQGEEEGGSTGKWNGAGYITCMHDYVKISPTIVYSCNTLIKIF